MTRIVRCGCSSTNSGNTAGAEYQDKIYGKGMRLANDKTPKGKYAGCVCTICSKVHS